MAIQTNQPTDTLTPSTGTLTVSGDIAANNFPVGANPSATAGAAAVNGSASTFMRSDGAPAIQKGSSSAFGVVKVDGSTITESGGVISAVGAGGSITTKDEGSTLTSSLTSLDFVGSGVVATNVSGAVTVTIAGGGGGYEAGTPTPPTTADLSTWLNQGTSTATDGTGAMIVAPQVNDQIHSLVKAVPAAPFDVYLRLNVQMLSTAVPTTTLPTAAGAIVFRNSSSGNILVFSVRYEKANNTDKQSLAEIRLDRFTGNGTTYSATPIVKYTVTPWQWIRVKVSALTSGTLTFYGSMDGKNWVQIGTELTATAISTITHYGVAAWANSDATEASISFSYFSTTAP